jgi:hypothetical protein
MFYKKDDHFTLWPARSIIDQGRGKGSLTDGVEKGELLPNFSDSLFSSLLNQYTTA